VAPGTDARLNFNRNPTARDWGALLFGYFLLDKQEKVTRCPKGSESL
jgi:hypothetical protein